MEKSLIRINMHSAYDHLQSWWSDDGIPFYNDKRVLNCPSGGCALLIEPKSLLPEVYEYIEKNYERFSYVFTHDSILLNKLPNAKLILWGGVWSWGDEEKDFNHPISMVASAKGTSPVRIQRRELAFELKGKVDTYGTFDGGEFVDTDTIYGKYPFSIVIENHIDDYWFTEKICNCFSHKTIPIYYGARKIDELFNDRGIIRCNSIDDIRHMLTILTGKNPYYLYTSRLDAIEDNYKRVKKYENFNTWFMNEYEDLLRGLL